MPKLSIITNTVRPAYLEYQASALMASKFQDFEWIIMDDIYDERKDMVAKFDLPVVHIKSPDIQDYFAVVKGHNLALKIAKGELIFYMIDYVVPHPDCLGRHWELYEEYPNAFFSGKSINVGITPQEMKGSVKGEDYRMGLYSQSIFQRRWVNGTVFESFADGVQNWWAGRNDSAPLEAILDVNGFDERLDGSHGYQDSDLGQRMMVKGYRYLLDTQSTCLEFLNPWSGKKKPGVRDLLEHEKLGKDIMKEVQEQGKYWVNPDFNLREERL